jgi:hypothetical protein
MRAYAVSHYLRTGCHGVGYRGDHGRGGGALSPIGAGDWSSPRDGIAEPSFQRLVIT